MHLVVDGYNVMHALPVGREWPGKTFQDRRTHFLERLRAYAAGRPHRITVVFDGTKGGDAMGGAESHGHVEVRFSPRHVTADELIHAMLDRAVRPADLLVVSSDKGISGYARHRGASTARADELVRRLGREDRPGPAPADAAAFERHVKGYDPDDAPRPARPRSRQALSLW